MAKQLRTLAGIVVAIAVAIFGYQNVQDGNADRATPVAAGGQASVAVSESAGDYSAAADQIVAAFESQRSDMWIEAGGRVQRVLPDDSEGSRHQRFIVSLPNEHTVLIAHNIDLAQRVPLKAGDPVSFYGEFEWNDRGGVVHWTHHDPRNRREGGWIRHKGTIYR
ncbi:MAG: DUF3465 domain-containing protein [Gammaproteobacteria bacterium]|nr:DUF3465 domain-containing protein [Gammaproteobacteria bacterium]NNF62359.1 DUF3465 domain-containing protein [Gammaproteobacteria bacterium]NNM21228.1 DUF3465 domain-containing protein [Gammaproteobacteria bacterium]